MSKFAFFDFDDTLAKGDSVLPYLMYCIRRGYAPWTQAPRAMLAYIKWLINPQCVSGAKETTLSFIKGRTEKEMQEIARGFFRDVQMKRVYAQGMQEILQLRSAGYEVVIVSASADVYMDLLTEFLPVTAVLATNCEKDAQGRYTGKIGANCKGEEKCRRIQAWLDQQGLTADWPQCRAYGDSPSDGPMLAMTGLPTLVHPKKKLRRILPDARQVHWR